MRPKTFGELADELSRMSGMADEVAGKMLEMQIRVRRLHREIVMHSQMSARWGQLACAAKELVASLENSLPRWSEMEFDEQTIRELRDDNDGDTQRIETNTNGHE